MAESKSAALPLGDAPNSRGPPPLGAGSHTRKPPHRHGSPRPQHHQPGRAHALAASAASAGVSNNAKHVAPDPLMRANKHFSVARNAASTSPITAARPIAGASRSFLSARRSAAMAAALFHPAGSAAGWENAPP